MEKVAYYNGKIGAPEELTMPVLDRAVYFGDGCYDATYVANGKILFLDDHFDRFYTSCTLLKIDFPYSREELKEILYKVVGQFDGEQGFIYWQTSRGTAERNHAFPENAKANLLIFLMPTSMRARDKTFKTISLEDNRFKLLNIKTLNLIPSVLAAQEAAEVGCDEVVFVRDGLVTEMAHSNVSIIKDGILYVHPLDNLVLPGIAIKHLKKMAGSVAVPVLEKTFDLETLMNAEEVIVTSSGTFCGRVVEVDGKPVGGKNTEVFNKLQNAVWTEAEEYLGTKLK